MKLMCKVYFERGYALTVHLCARAELTLTMTLSDTFATSR